jgi:NAD+ kinase
MGTTGFMSAADESNWLPLFKRWREGGAVLSRRMMLEVSLERQGGAIFEARCLNDAVISSDGIAKIIRLRAASTIAARGLAARGLAQLGGDCEENGDGENEAGALDMPRVYLGRFRADGLIAATATGSTAYSAAAGGPILDPEMEAIIINPVSPFTLSNRPLVLPPNERITIEVEAEQRCGVLLTIDGQLTEKLLPLDRIVIKKAPYKAALVGSGRASFYRALRGKLGWSGGSDQTDGEGGEGVQGIGGGRGEIGEDAKTGSAAVYAC